MYLATDGILRSVLASEDLSLPLCTQSGSWLLQAAFQLSYVCAWLGVREPENHGNRDGNWVLEKGLHFCIFLQSNNQGLHGFKDGRLPYG